MFIKFEYLKFAGCLEDIRVFEHLTGFVQVIMKVDGILIPNVKVPIQIYEDLEKGSHVEFYALVQNSKNKVKNTAIVLAAKTASGRLLRVPSMRYKVQLHFLGDCGDVGCNCICTKLDCLSLWGRFLDG
ncbi:hypothetical protein PPS11_02578 [Pseudomonas putida S11]|nr:hypothetical protein PPS11_02578 [Pseudomonas putida S11]